MDREPAFITHCRTVLAYDKAAQYTWVINNGLDRFNRQQHIIVIPAEAALVIEHWDKAREGVQDVMRELYDTRPAVALAVLRRVTAWRGINRAAALAEIGK